MIEIYQKYEIHQNKGFFQKSHGLDILRVVVCDLLEELEMLNPSNFNKVSTNSFLHHVLLTLQAQYNIKFQSVDDLKTFLSYSYFMSERNICDDILKQIITKEMVLDFLEGKIQIIEDYEEKNDVTQKQKEGEEQDMVKESRDKEEQKSDEGQETNEINNGEAYENDSEEKKEQYFHYLEEKSINEPDPLKQVQDILDQYPKLKFKEDYNFIKVNDRIYAYTYWYKCYGMQIPPITSEHKYTQKEAKANAARLLFPHILFYHRYQHPFIRESYVDIEEQEETSQLDEHQLINEEELERNMMEDLLIFNEKCSEEITEVYQILQEQLGFDFQRSLKVDIVRSQNNVYYCLVIFSQYGQEKLRASAVAISKQVTKQVAFYKLKPDLQRYFYEQNGSYYSLFEEKRPQKAYKRRNRQDDESNE